LENPEREAAEHRRLGRCSVSRLTKSGFQKEKIVFHRSLIALAANVTVLSIGQAANAQASAPAATAKPVAPAQRTFTRTEITQDINTKYQAVDANGDGAVTVSEVVAAQTKAQQVNAALYAKRVDDTFRTLDTNKDGQLSPAELKAGSPVPRLSQPDPARLVSEMDSNKDQKVSLAEFGAPMLASFDHVDTNHDGIVTPDETQKARAAARK
jgi:Ca2+-binding EF-hand superfamily protein